jgi:hypothetical protein
VKQLSGPCPGDNCPKLFDDGDSYVVQGEIVTALAVPDGEGAVRVPKAILDVLKGRPEQA